MSDYTDEEILKYIDEMAGYTPPATDNPNYYSYSGSNMTTETPADTSSGYDYLSQYVDMFYSSGAIEPQSSLGQTLAQVSGNPNYYSSSQSNMTEDKSSTTDNIIDKLTGGIKKAYDKDPLAFLKMGMETVGGAIKAQRERETVERAARSRIEEQNNAAAIDAAQKKAYTDSFGNRKPRQPQKQAPLTRVGGLPVYDGAGRVVRS